MLPELLTRRGSAALVSGGTFVIGGQCLKAIQCKQRTVSSHTVLCIEGEEVHCSTDRHRSIDNYIVPSHKSQQNGFRFNFIFLTWNKSEHILTVALAAVLSLWYLEVLDSSVHG